MEEKYNETILEILKEKDIDNDYCYDTEMEKFNILNSEKNR